MFHWATLLALCVLSFALGAGLGRGLCFRGSARRGAAARVLPGTVGRVSVSIPPRGVGAVAHWRFGRRATLPARALDGCAIEGGSSVVIVDVKRKVALVEKLSDDIQEMFK